MGVSLLLLLFFSYTFFWVVEDNGTTAWQQSIL